MSTWYRAGTISVTNGSTAVAGSGTAFVGIVNKGDALQAPDGRSYEISTVNSNTSLTLASSYQGSSASGQAYAIQPTRAVALEWLQAVQAFQSSVTGWQDGPLSGLFGNGSAGAPGIAFSAQINTGFFRPAASVLALSVNGTERARLTTSGMQLTGLLSGTAVTQSSTDTTSGRLTKVGDFGLGTGNTLSFDASDDLDDAVNLPVLFFRTVNASNSPPGSSGNGQGLILKRGGITSNPNTALIYVDRNEDTYTRVHKGTFGWADWRKLYDTGNILGTVSQSSGAPTGAIIERGSNANGEFVRYADGTQIFWVSVQEDDVSFSPEQGVYISPRFTYVYPASFSEPPSAQVTHFRRGGDTGVIWASLDNPPGVNSIDIRAIRASSDTRNIGFNIAVFGRWF